MGQYFMLFIYGLYLYVIFPWRNMNKLCIKYKSLQNQKNPHIHKKCICQNPN